MIHNFNFFTDLKITHIYVCNEINNLDFFINNYNLSKTKLFNNHNTLFVDYNFESIMNDNFFLWINIPSNTNFKNIKESNSKHFTHNVSIYNILKDYCDISLIDLCFIDTSKYKQNIFIQNKILIIDDFVGFDDKLFNKIKKDMKYNKLLFSKNITHSTILPDEFCEISNNIICALLIIGDNFNINLDTYNLINKLYLCNVPIISNKTISKTIKYDDSYELLDIINYNIKSVNNFQFDNFFTKKNINQIMIADYNKIYKNIKKNYCLHDSNIYKYLEKNYENMDIAFFGYNDSIKNKLTEYKAKKYIIWTYEDIHKIYDEIINLDVIHICITETIDKIFTELNIKHHYNKINLFNCKIYDNYHVLNNYYPMLDDKNIVIYNPHDDISDKEIKEKFKNLENKYNIYLFHEIDNTIQINYFIDLSHYYDFKLEPLFNYKIYFSTIIYSNNLTESDNIKNFYDIDEIITKII